MTMKTSAEITREAFLGSAGGRGGDGRRVGASCKTRHGRRRRAAQAGRSASMRPWAAHDYRVALDAMAEAGFKYAGLMTTKSKSGLLISADTALEDAAKIGEEVKKRRLSVVSIYGGGIPVAQSLETGIQGLRRLIDNCHATGCPSLLMGGVDNPKLQRAPTTRPSPNAATTLPQRQ